MFPHQGFVGHVRLLLELHQPPLQVVAGALRLLPEMLLPLFLPLQPLPLQLPDRRRTQPFSAHAACVHSPVSKLPCERQGTGFHKFGVH